MTGRVLYPATAVGGAAFGLSVRHGLWLFALGFIAAVVVVARRELRERRSWLPVLLAIRALSSTGAHDSSGGQSTTAGELAVIARADADVLALASHLVRQHDHPRWATALAEIAAAQHIVERGLWPGTPAARPTSSSRVVCCVVVACGFLVAAAITRALWVIIPLAAAYTAAVAVWTDWREERRWRPQLVAAAAAEPSRPVAIREDDGAAAHLAVIAQTHRPVERAVRLLEQWPGGAAGRPSAVRRLSMAALLLRDSGVTRARRRRVALLVGTFAAGFAATVTPI